MKGYIYWGNIGVAKQTGSMAHTTLPMVQSYALEGPTDDREVAHLLRCIQGEKQREPRPPVPPSGVQKASTFGKAPRKALKVKVPARAKKAKKTTGGGV